MATFVYFLYKNLDVRGHEPFLALVRVCISMYGAHSPWLFLGNKEEIA